MIITFDLNLNFFSGAVKYQYLTECMFNFILATWVVDKVVKKAFSLLAFIGQCIEYKSWDVMYKSLIRPQLQSVVLVGCH